MNGIRYDFIVVLNFIELEIILHQFTIRDSNENALILLRIIISCVCER